MTRSQTHQEIRQRCWCAATGWCKTPSPTSLRAWTLMGKWIVPVKVHILQSENLFGCSLGYPLHLRNPACVIYQGIVCKSLFWSVPGLRSHPYYLTLPPLLHRLPGYILLLFLFQGLLKVPYISPEAMLRAAGTKNRTNCLAV